MKKTVFYLALTAVLISCKQEQKKLPTGGSVEPPILFIHIGDATKSNDSAITSYSDTAIARRIYMAIADNGGGVIRILHVLPQSQRQEVVSITVKPLNLINTDTIGNIYLKKKNLRQNQQIQSSFYRQAENSIQKYISAISREHNGEYSDVYNALLLTKTTTEIETYSGYRKIVATFSDLQHTQKGGKSKLQPVQLLDDIKVLCVRPALTEQDLKKLFSSNPNLHLLTNAEDIIPFIFTQSN